LVWINEFHYDDAGGDANEGIEIAAKAGTSLDGWKIEFYNGSDEMEYSTLSLSGTVPDVSNGYGTIWFPKSGIQNGSNDGFALIDAAGSVVQFLSYEGTLTAQDGTAVGLSSTDVGVSEGGGSANESLQLQGTGYRYIDFSWTGPTTRTHGNFSVGQTISVP